MTVPLLPPSVRGVSVNRLGTVSSFLPIPSLIPNMRSTVVILEPTSIISCSVNLMPVANSSASAALGNWSSIMFCMMFLHGCKASMTAHQSSK